jgi:hydrogenase expression/formation protein HypD
MTALLSDPALAIDGFLAPGHVSVILGSAAYEPVARLYRRPCVVAGFDANQMLMAMVRILCQLLEEQPRVENVYRDRVTPAGNRRAREIMAKVFAPAASRWRGLGLIPASGLQPRAAYAAHDARLAFHLPEPPDHEPPGCRCAEVLKGRILPPDCPLFARRCTPVTPVGACMVSREGACSAYHRYRQATS